jgi:spermidine/putrescine-binding protein
MAAIPNASRIDPSLLHQDFDPGNQWSLPYSWAVTGITYNKSKVSKRVSGYKDLLTRADLRLRFSLLDDSREAFAAALKSIHQSANATDPKVLAAARDILIKTKPRVREFTATPSALLESGDLMAAQIYSNESLRLIARRPEFEFIVPSEGYTIAIDSFAIPKKSKHKADALLLMNFLLEPQHNLAFSQELLAAPVIQSISEQLGKELRFHPAINSFAAIKSRGEMLRDVGEAIRTYDRMWTEVKVSDLASADAP